MLFRSDMNMTDRSSPYVSGPSGSPPVGAVRASRRRFRPRTWSLAGLFGCACVFGMLSGCAGPGLGAAVGSIPDADWPRRITVGLEDIAANTPAFLTTERGETPAGGGSRDNTKSGKAAVRVIRCEVHGLGIVLELASAEPDEPPQPASETELVFVSFSALARDGSGVELARRRLPSRLALSHVRAGVRWEVYEPSASPSRGLIVHLGGNKYVRRALLKHGWTVLSSSGTGRYSRRRASPQVFAVAPGDELGDLAIRLATVFDDELADWPYSLEAVLEYLAEHRPDLSQRPTAVMGFSIGALGLPAVVTRMPDRFQAAVVVAGGANLLEVSQHSRKENTGIVLKWEAGKQSKEDWQQLRAAYLDSATLDPYHTAATLATVPVLMVHARYDQVVPAATGEVLYARLGRPKRLVFPVGHRHLLRIVMRLEANRIVEWTEAAISGQSDE